MLRDAITNVVDNAINDSPSGSTIAMRIEADAVDATLSVTDEGPGIPAEHRERIWDRFYRVDEGRSRGSGGAGLGLAIAKWAVEANEGRMSLASSGSGSVFESRCHGPDRGRIRSQILESISCASRVRWRRWRNGALKMVWERYRHDARHVSRVPDVGPCAGGATGAPTRRGLRLRARRSEERDCDGGIQQARARARLALSCDIPRHRPQAELSVSALAGLRADGLEIPEGKPMAISAADVSGATHIFAIGYTLPASATASGESERLE